MAVAVKKTPETSTSSVFDRMPVASLVGMVYRARQPGRIVFGLIPHLWSRMWASVFGSSNAFASMTLVGMIMLAAAAGLVVLGNRLLGPKPPLGANAGIFTGLLALLLVACVSRCSAFGSRTASTPTAGSGPTARLPERSSSPSLAAACWRCSCAGSFGPAPKA